MAKNIVVLEGWYQNGVGANCTIPSIERRNKYIDHGNYISIRPGKIVGIGVIGYGNVISGILTVTVCINNNPSSMFTTLDATHPNFNYTVNDIHGPSFSIGDPLTISSSTTNTIDPPYIDIEVWIEIEI